MKKIIFSLACAAMCCACDAQHSLTVKLSDLKSDSVQIIVVDKDFSDAEKQDVVIAKNGEFYYDFTGNKARMAVVGMTNAKGPARLQVFLVPGEQGILTGTTELAKWSGTQFYTDLGKLEETTDPLMAKMNAIYADAEKKMEAGGNPDSIQNAITPELETLSEQLSKTYLDYIKANTNNNVSATLLTSIPDQELGLALLSDNVKTGVFSDFIETIEKGVKQEKARIEAAKKVADGMMAPDFTLKDINGKDLTLSSLRGKYVVLDFWGSWCPWCIKGMPEMKSYYDKYSSKLELIGVDCNDTEQKWKDAVKKHNMTWKQVYCPKGCDVPTKYAVSGFPTKIVIDTEGKILKTVCGEDPAFYSFLDETLGK